MLRIGSRISFDSCGRVTIPKELADMLNLTKGNDLVYWSVEDGKSVLRKVTQPLYGIDIEQEEIEKNLREFEQKHSNCQDFSGLSEAERRRLALKEYQRRKRSD